MDRKLIVITGPTAVGKTELAIKIATHFNTEIVNCDSRQFYRELEIGTAKPTKEELNTCKHHFVNNLSINDVYSVGQYMRQAHELLNTLFRHHEYIVLTGGTGLFINAVLHGIDEFPEVSEQTFERVKKKYESSGIEVLQEQLKNSDPEYYSKVDVQNPQRLIRAVSVIEESGKPFSSFLSRQNFKRNFTYQYHVITRDRKDLYDRINKRVDIMIQNGLLEEVKAHNNYRMKNALQTVGYKELFEYLDGVYDLDFAIEKIKQHTRNYAKRQLTWFRKIPEAIWFDGNHDSIDNFLNNIQSNDFVYSDMHK